MSTPYPGPAYPGPAVPPPTATPQKRRPSAAWFVVGAVLLLAAVIAFGVAAGRIVHAFDTEARISGPGYHEVTLAPHVERAVFVRGRYVCQAVDGDGTTVDFRRPDSRVTFGDWRLVARLDTGDGHLTLRCTGPRGEAHIVALPTHHAVVSALVLGLLVPFLLTVAGLTVLLVAAVLWFSRRQTPAVPGAMPPPT